MSPDAKNSIFLWVGALVFAGLFWTQFAPRNLPRWLGPVLFTLLTVNATRSIWNWMRKRKA
jgi:hypothetical protein